MNTSPVQSIDINDFLLKQEQNETLIIVDTRSATSFVDGFIPGAIFISLEDDFEKLAVQLLPKEEEIILLSEDGKEKESFDRLRAAGYENITGFLSGGIDVWKASSWANDIVIEVDADELMMDIPFDQHLLLIDVREETEFDKDHFEGAENLPLSKLTDPGTIAMIEDHHNVYIISQTGYRSLIAASLLKRQGLHNIRIVKGGWDEVKKIL